MLKIRNREAVIIDNTIRIDEQYNMRLDVIVERYYGTCEHINKICVFNHLLCPFDLKVGMIIELPNIESLEQQLYEPKHIEVQNNTKNKNVGGSRVTKSNGIIKF